jgi:hypothetical protein
VLKRSLANLAKRNLTELTALVKTRLKRMQYRAGLLDGFLASTGLDLTPFRNPRIKDRFSSDSVLAAVAGQGTPFRGRCAPAAACRLP